MENETLKQRLRLRTTIDQLKLLKEVLASGDSKKASVDREAFIAQLDVLVEVAQSLGWATTVCVGEKLPDYDHLLVVNQGMSASSGRAGPLHLTLHLPDDRSDNYRCRERRVNESQVQAVETLRKLETAVSLLRKQVCTQTPAMVQNPVKREEIAVFKLDITVN